MNTTPQPPRHACSDTDKFHQVSTHNETYLSNNSIYYIIKKRAVEMLPRVQGI